jgi:UDP-N-acetylmuramate dehydrogenase
MAFEDLPYVRKLVPLATTTSFGLGGPAEYFATPRSVSELAVLVRRCHEMGVLLRVLGGGTNILVADAGVGGVVVRLSSPALTRIEISGTRVVAGTGAKLEGLISATVRKGLAGLETLSGIPGTVGGALRGNSGTRYGEIASVLSRVTLMDAAGAIRERERREIAYGYRKSDLGGVIIAGEFPLKPEDPGTLGARRRSYWKQKKASQPLGARSAGCVFKNSARMPAGMLIERAGWKGVKVGGARVSDVHANFIVTDPGASSRDVARLIELIRRSVSARFGVDLEQEVVLW